MDEWVQDLIQNNDDFKLGQYNKIRCISTGHDLVAKKEVIEKYMNGPSYTYRRDYNKDFSEYEPYITSDRHNNKLLFCRVTKTKLNKNIQVVERHIKGRKYTNLLEAFKLNSAQRQKRKEKYEKKQRLMQLQEGSLDSSDDEAFAELMALQSSMIRESKRFKKRNARMQEQTGESVQLETSEQETNNNLPDSSREDETVPHQRIGVPQKSTGGATKPPLKKQSTIVPKQDNDFETVPQQDVGFETVPQDNDFETAPQQDVGFETVPQQDVGFETIPQKNPEIPSHETTDFAYLMKLATGKTPPKKRKIEPGASEPPKKRRRRRMKKRNK
eukprot:TRINITY_DN1738_c0_g1_i2.p1 TRINITY_DN1738_c0_g1~~TRINITY_DN1738_c0_g1_i2.p1  ORF type:complete len:373 (-),score=85.43 TRINITY_DN1738_c0_g1_i2:124-1110(-)